MPGSKKDRSNQGRYPCVVCSTQVTIHQKALQCDNCDEWTHFKCTPLTCDEYSNLAKSSKDWYCGNCESICGDIDAAEAVQRAEAAAARRAEAAERAEAEGVDEGNERVELSSGGEEEEDVNGGSGDHDTDSLQMANPSEELLALLEDDFIKNLGNLVDVLKLKFEQIHTMQQRNKQLETENRSLRQQLTEKTEEVDILQQKLASQAEPQTEIRRLNGMVRGLRESMNSKLESQISSGRQTDALTDRQGRMATVLGRMTNFLSGLSEDLTKTDTFMPVAQTPPSSTTNMANIPSRPSSADSHSTSDNRPKNTSDRRYGRRRRQLETSVASLLQKTERRLRQATKCGARNCASGAPKRSTSCDNACRSCHNPTCSRSPARGARRSQTLPRVQNGRHRNLPPKFTPNEQEEKGKSARRIKTERKQTVALTAKPKPGDDDSTRCDVTIVTLVTDDSGNMRVVNQAKGTVEDRSGMTPDQAPYSPSNDVRRIVHTYIEQCSNPSDTPVDSSPWIHTSSNRASPREPPFYTGFVHQFDGNEELNDLNSGLTNGNLNITVTPLTNSPIDNVDSVVRVSTPLEISTSVWNGANTSRAEETETESEYHSLVGDSTVDYERNNSSGEMSLKKRIPSVSSHDGFSTPGRSPLKFSPLKTAQTGRRSSDVGVLMGAFSPVVRLDDISPRMTPNRFEPIHPSHHEVAPLRIKLKPKPQKIPSGEISPIKVPETLFNSKPKPNISNENAATTVVITPRRMQVENGGDHSRIYHEETRTEESICSEEPVPPLRRVQSPSMDQALPRTNVIVEVPMEIDACGEGLGAKSKRQHADRFSDSDSTDSEISFPNSPKKGSKIPSPAKKKTIEPKSSTPSKILLSSITKKKYLKRKGAKAGILSPNIVLTGRSSSPAVTVDSQIFSTPLLAQEMKRKPGRPPKKSKTPKTANTPTLKSLDVSKVNPKLTPSLPKTKVKARKSVNCGRKSSANDESQNGGQKKRKRQSSADDVKLKLIPVVKLVKFDG